MSKAKDRFKLANGGLTAYALLCGYVQEAGDKTKSDSKYCVELYMEHSHYHVRSFDYAERDNSTATEWNAEGSWRTWDTFGNDELSQARKAFAVLKRKFKQKYPA